jgi:RNA polymerase sigma-70 factor (ECF subfamily)
MKRKENIIHNESFIIQQFNRRENQGFGEVYLHLHDELYYFADKLFQSVNITPEDVIQDIFIHIWEKKDTSFDSLKALKSYLYIAIKNQYIKHLEHLKRVDAYNRQMLLDEKQFVVLVAENEILSVLSQSADILPEECAKVFRLCLEGWEIKEIADKLGKSESTVYKQRDRAVTILRNKLSKGDFLIILLALYG